LQKIKEVPLKRLETKRNLTKKPENQTKSQPYIPHSCATYVNPVNRTSDNSACVV